jgi:FG-GAP-like repeat
MARRAWGIGWALGAATGLVGACLQPAKDLGNVKPDAGPPTVCTIDGVVYAPAAPNPMNGCEACQPSASASGWSHAADATPCGDAGLFCIGGTCDAPCSIQGVPARSHQHNPENLNQCCLPSMSTTAWSEWFQDGGQILLGSAGGFVPLAGDFNGDGQRDLALENGLVDPAGITILLNRGDGTFEAPRVFPWAAPPTSGAFVVSDLDHDGLDDLICQGQGAPSALVNQRGGTFGTPIEVAGATVVAGTGDFNGDGIPDLLTYGEGATQPRAGLLLGLGHGAFAAPLALDLGDPSSLARLALARLRGPGQPLDVVQWDPVTSSFSVLLGDGRGGFAAPAVTASGNGFSSIQIVDFNGDGRDDVVGSSGSDSLLYVFLSQPDGALGPAMLTALDFPRGVERYVLAADFDGDHLSDLAGVASEPPGQTVTNLLWRLPDGGVSAPITVGSPGYVLYVIDFNGDGAPDLLTLPTGTSDTVAQLYLNACGAP